MVIVYVERNWTTAEARVAVVYNVIAVEDVLVTGPMISRLPCLVQAVGLSIDDESLVSIKRLAHLFQDSTGALFEVFAANFNDRSVMLARTIMVMLLCSIFETTIVVACRVLFSLG